MIFKGWYICIFLSFVGSICALIEPIWPTPNSAFIVGKGLEDFVQPTASGNVISGCFGCVRKNKSGRSAFHEGLDLFPVKRNKKNEPLDDIYAIWPGRVVYISKHAGNSNYGIYVVLEHEEMPIKFYTLYGHLAKVSESLKLGQKVDQRAILGRMGYTSSDRIPKSRAHLHFEIGVRLSNNFEKWYQKNDFHVSNYHGIWNGMNLIGIDPLDFFVHCIKNKNQDLINYITSLPTAFTVTFATQQIPDFIKRYPQLLQSLKMPVQVDGWEIDFTWYGLPKNWRPIIDKKSVQGNLQHPIIINYDIALLKANPCRKTVIFNKKNQPEVGPELRKILDIVF